MMVAGVYSFKGGKEVVEAQYASELMEIQQVIASIDSDNHKTKVSKEKTMPGRMLYNPRSLNRAITAAFAAQNWAKYRVTCEYSVDYYIPGYQAAISGVTAYREMDFIKNRLGVEVQLGSMRLSFTTSARK